MGQIWAIISTIREVITVIKAVITLIIEWRKHSLDNKFEKEKGAIDKLKDAKTKEERENAAKDSARNSY